MTYGICPAAHLGPRAIGMRKGSLEPGVAMQDVSLENMLLNVNPGGLRRDDDMDRYPVESASCHFCNCM